MQTRRRNYTTNPRSPPRRRRRAVRNWKTDLPKTPLPRRASTSSSILISQQQSSPTFFALPTQRDSSLSSSSLSKSSKTNESEDHKSSNSSSPRSIGTLSNLAKGLSNLHLDNKTCVPHATTSQSSYPQPLSEIPYDLPNMQSWTKHEKIGDMSSPMSTLDQYALHKIDQATKNLNAYTKFSSLEKDGSNFIEWKKNTSRAMKAMLRINNFWDAPQPLISYIDLTRDKLANAVIANTIHEDLKNVTDDTNNAYEAMTALQRHFRRGGRTNQFALFSRLVNHQLDLNETDILTHIASIDSIISELESTGFTWTSETVKGLFYQLRMPAEMTKEINKDLDNRFNDKQPNFDLQEIKAAIQIHLARERTESETMSINNLSTSVEAFAFKTPQRSQHSDTAHPRYVTMSRSQGQRYSHSTSPYHQKTSIDAELKARWRRGPAAITTTSQNRQASEMTPLKIPATAHPNVKNGVIQCFFCGGWGHSYRDTDFKGCNDFNNNKDRTGAHYNDWRKLENGRSYSLNVLYLNQSRGPAPKVNAVNVNDSDVHVSSMELNSEGVVFSDEGDAIPREYLFDGGATDSVSNDLRLLTNYKPLPKPIPIQTAANDSSAVIVGRGTIPIRTEDGGEDRIDDVYYCPKATATIISPGALLAKGAKVKMDEKHNYSITLVSGKKIRAYHKNRRWFINPWSKAISTCNTSSLSSCAIHSTGEVSRLWHNRFGHVSMKRIRELFKQGSEYGLPRVVPQRDVTCEDCLKCKSTRSRTLGSTNRRHELMDVMVSDVAGPFSQCLTGEKLIVTFRDVATGYTEIEIIKNKSEVPQKLMQTIKKWERQTNKSIKIIRSDRGGEYIGAALEKWLKEEGIKHEFSNPYEPEQNGNAERLNRTLGEMARTMLSHSRLPNQFWNFAYLTSAYLYNRLPNTLTGNKTPYELFHGRKPNLDIIRTFGSLAFVHVNNNQRAPGKLEDRGRRCTMVGYVEGGKGWVFYDAASKSLIKSAIAKFPYEDIKDETEEIKTNNSSKTSSESLNKLMNPDLPNKGRLNHILNALKLGDFTDEINIDKQDVAAKHALDGRDYLKILKPPQSYAAAMRASDSEKWKEACDAEMRMMDTMGVWKVVDKPSSLVPIDLKWVFAYKKVDDDGNPIKYKARLVAKGYNQREGIDYTETFAPTATFAGLRIMLTIAAHQNWPVHSFDITSAYLHSRIDSPIYFSLPTGYMCDARKKNQVLEAIKALYGTKQGARCWWKHFDSILKELGFSSSQYDQSLYFFRRGNDTIIIWLHSDDGGVTGSSEKILFEVAGKLKEKLLIKWEANLDQIVGVNVERDTDGNFTLSQPGLTKKILKSFLLDEKTVKTPMNPQKIPCSPIDDEEKVDVDRYLSAIGSLNYLSVATRPDITYTVNYLARFSSDPRRQHWQAIEHIMRYLNTTGIKSLRIKPIKSRVTTPLQTYVDANWGGEGARSSHGYITYFLNCPISWTSKRQTCVASSTCHAEYMALGTACRDAIWLRNLVEDLTGEGNIVGMNCDNTSAIHVAKDNSSNKRTRHADREFYYVNEQIYKGRIFLNWIDSKSQRADILTNPLGPTLHNQALDQLRLTSN